jgi:ABC-type dipeptide/oligopeptide/nickel transport system permease component
MTLRVVLLLGLLIAANFAGYAYAYLARTISGNPFFARQADTGALWPGYAEYVQSLLRGEAVQVAVYKDGFLAVLASATVASLGLLAIALVVSVGLGLLIGLAGARLHPPGVRDWLTGGTILGLSTPSFFVGRILIVLSLAYLAQRADGGFWLPTHGFGWDWHLVLPVMALAVRPTALVAQVVAAMLAGELSKQYIVAARGKGLAERRVVVHHALRNVWGPVAQSMAGAVRLLVADLIVVEWLFGWPGLGYLMAATLIPAEIASSSIEGRYLDPPMVASLVTIFAAIFLAADVAAGSVARWADPRQRA